jgi:hypothetical protein
MIIVETNLHSLSQDIAITLKTAGCMVIAFSIIYVIMYLIYRVIGIFIFVIPLAVFLILASIFKGVAFNGEGALLTYLIQLPLMLTTVIYALGLIVYGVFICKDGKYD